MKKIVVTLIILLAFLIMAIFVSYSSANFTPTLPSDNIIIETDGRVVGTDKIVRNGNIYTFMDNVSGTKTVQGNMNGNMSSALAIHKSNIIIDGAGYTLQCNGITGIDISNGVCQKDWATAISENEIWNVTIKNLRITNCSIGIQCYFGGNHTFYSNYISNDYVNQNGTGNFAWDNVGIAFWGSNGNNINYCTIGGSPAIYMHFGCSNNVATRNNIVFGAHLSISGNETFDTNYWSDFLVKYPNSSQTDYSGTWSTPYSIVDSQNENSLFQDIHPLISPQSIPYFSTILPTVQSIQEPLVFPLELFAVFIITVLVAFAVGLLIYFKKHKSKME